MSSSTPDESETIRTPLNDFPEEFLEKIRKMNKEAEESRREIFAKAIEAKKSGKPIEDNIIKVDKPKYSFIVSNLLEVLHRNH